MEIELESAFELCLSLLQLDKTLNPANSDSIDPQAENPGQSYEAPFSVDEVVAGKYRIESVLGHGGMGVVYKVRQTFLDKVMALKVLHTTKIDGGASIRRFQQEALATGALDHPNLIRVRDFGLLDSGEPYMAMDYVEGITLDAHLHKHGPIALDKMIAIFYQLCAGVSSAHGAGVIHRDLKPRNIMLLPGALRGIAGTVKIIDFGIAKIATEDGDMQKLTRTGEVFGSPAYMSPEQCDGLGVDNRTDIYSLGCVLFEALTGSPPYVNESALKVMLSHQTAPIPSLHDASLGRDFPAAAELVIQKMLAKSPGARYLDATVASRELSGIDAPSFVEPKSKKPVLSQYLTTSIKFSLVQLLSLILVCMLGSATLTATAVKYGTSIASEHERELQAEKDANDPKRNMAELRKTMKTHIEGTTRMALMDSQLPIEPVLQSGIANRLQIQKYTRGETEHVLPFIVFDFPSKPIGAITTVTNDDWNPRVNEKRSIAAVNTVRLNKRDDLVLRVDLGKIDSDRDLNEYLSLSPWVFRGVEIVGSGSAFFSLDEMKKARESSFITSLLTGMHTWAFMQYLKLEQIELDRSEVEALNKFKKLTQLQLMGTDIPAEADDIQMTCLTKLEYFGFNQGLLSRFTPWLCQSKALNLLELSSTFITSEDLDKFKACPNLKTMLLNDVRTDDGLLLKNVDFARSFAQLPHLENLRIGTNSVTVSFVNEILKSKTIKNLWLDTNVYDLVKSYGVNDSRLKNFKSFPWSKKKTEPLVNLAAGEKK